MITKHTFFIVLHQSGGAGSTLTINSCSDSSPDHKEMALVPCCIVHTETQVKGSEETLLTFSLVLVRVVCFSVRDC